MLSEFMASFIYIQRGGGSDLFIIQQFVERVLTALQVFSTEELNQSSVYLSFTGIDLHSVFLSDSHRH